MAEDEEPISEERAKEVVREFAESRETTTGFFTKVVRNPDTTKTGNVTSEELGISNHPVRTYKELEIISRDIFEDESWAEYFHKLAEIQLATSLSKDGFLLRLIGTSRKEIADVSPKERKANSGWFKGRKNKDDNQGGQS